jgi:hypothetical protein
LEVDLEKAKKGKPLGYDEDGKRKRNLTPEVYVSITDIPYFVFT